MPGAVAAAADPRLAKYLDLLGRWNATYNLTSVRDPAAMQMQHVADCLAVVAPLRREVAGRPRPLRILDVGSGGGLPGVVLALAEPEWNVSCIDAVGKKAAFVRQAAVELGLSNLQSLHGRVEALKAEPFDVITARAFSSLVELVRLTRPLLAAGGLWMAMKGRRPDDELAVLPDDLTFHVEHIAVPGLAAERCLVWIRTA